MSEALQINTSLNVLDISRQKCENIFTIPRKTQMSIVYFYNNREQNWCWWSNFIRRNIENKHIFEGIVSEL